jgi:hypothetical protein
MEFLMKIQTMINITSENRDLVFKPAQDKEARNDAELKKVHFTDHFRRSFAYLNTL